MSASHELEVGGAKAIEVATMLGDSVIDVKHCLDPSSGKVSSKTWALLAVGIACVLASALAFYVSVSTAAYNHGALEYWTQVANKPAYAYRPQLVGAGYDWVAFGGLTLGIVGLALAILRIRDERRSPYYRIGTAPGVEQPLAGAPSPSFALVAPTQAGDDFVFNFAAGMTGEVQADGRATPLADLAASGRARPSPTIAGAFELPIPAQARIRATLGQAQFVVSAVPRPRRHAAPLFAGLQSKTGAYFAGSLVAHLGIVLLLSQLPIDGGAATIDIGTQEMAWIKVDNKMQEETPLEQLERELGAGGEEGAGASMELAEGAAGDPKSQRADGKLRIKDKGLDPQLARMQAIEVARTAGILGSSSLAGDAFASMLSTHDFSNGPDGADVWGPIFGADGEGKGYFGYGRSGFGAGGGCGENCGIIGTEPGYGTIGLGRYGRSGWAPGNGGGVGTRKRTPGIPGPVIGQPTGTGDLDKAIIRRYIKRNVDKIAYCYEKELLAKPGIQGSIMVTFFIAPNGTVKSATGAGFEPTVANCVADVIGRIEFPRPAGGAGVQVNYPFTFHAAGR